MADASLERLVSYTTWANQAWAKHIDRYPGDEYLLKTLTHIAKGELAWFQRIHGLPVGRDIWAPLPLQELNDLLLSNAQIYYAVLQGNLDRVIFYTRFNGDQHSSSISDILLHLCSHGSHHRGQMSAHASKMGFDVINTDYINYTRAIKR